ncbi:Hypothetical protein NTJ_03773 [Nesidiocoris tenuis]|uniref:Uncharacterized protein n=1 Tax=Nesidiocoris tenuis TaxID=355587 RepID=A0ABN7AF99_9HEMI|nr:Hypothetical protein NTJ_03773 [Nesidiocoris tenuis]
MEGHPVVAFPCILLSHAEGLVRHPVILVFDRNEEVFQSRGPVQIPVFRINYTKTCRDERQSDNSVCVSPQVLCDSILLHRPSVGSLPSPS